MSCSALQLPLMLHRLLTHPSRRHRLIWFGVSLAIAALYSFWAMQQAFSGNYVVQDDARQHVFWMQRFADPELFPNDLIADYFQGVAPLGYVWLYHGLASFGLHPFLVAKILPFFLALVMTSYFYWLVLEFFPVPFAGFISTVSFSQSWSYSSELSSGTPRAFLYPLLIAFIYYLVREKPALFLLCLVLQSLFYPQISLICLGVLALRLITWSDQKFVWNRNRKAYWQFATGLVVIGAILLYTQGKADFGEVISRAEAIALPEFQMEGRNAFFSDGLTYWFNGRSGMFHKRGFTPGTLVAGSLLPILMWLPLKSRLRQQVNPQVGVLLKLLVVSLGLFFLAHLLLFQLHLPSRYTSHTVRAVLGLTCGISLVIILDETSRLIIAFGGQRFGRQFENSELVFNNLRQSLFASFSVFLAVFVILYPVFFLERFPRVGYYDFAAQQKLYEFFAEQPKDSVIASLAGEASNIPMFSGRMVLVSPEHAIAYHKGYYGEFRQRAEDLITAHYTPYPEPLLKATTAYGIDFWLVGSGAFQPTYVSSNDWLLQYQPMAERAVQQLTTGQVPILQQALPICTVASIEKWSILDATCVYNFTKKLTDRAPKNS